MEFIEEFYNLFNSPTFGLVIKVVTIYIALLWISLIIWVARDVINRSNNIIFQTAMIILNILLPVFGLIIYLIIRPPKTLVERYYEDMEYNLLTDSSHQNKFFCPSCSVSLDKDFVFCPECKEKVQRACAACKKCFEVKWEICPYCGKAQEKEEKGEIILTKTTLLLIISPFLGGILIFKHENSCLLFYCFSSRLFWGVFIGVAHDF